MSATIDNRVVGLGFDNRQFQSGVEDSLRSIDQLKSGLNLDDSARSLNNLASAGRSFSLDNIGASVQSVTGGFSALGIVGVTALVNLTNSAIETGKRLLSALTIDSAKMGFGEYETQMGAIQTTLANTASKGTTLKDVNAALKELNDYSDKTIYNFTEMAKNIGTFTAAGLSLEVSTASIKGIANLAAVSGSNSQQASTAMYQLSQALSSGTVKLMDWNSVVNAGMGGQLFQESLKETARLHGVAIDKMIKDEGSFRETLQNGWLTADILSETLAKFTGDLTEADLGKMGYTKEQIKQILALGVTANDAATKVKTLTQLWDTLKEAAQSGWAQSWLIIIGEFDEAKLLMTEISTVIGGIIGESSAARITLLEDWKKFGGRIIGIEALRNTFEAVLAVVKLLSQAFTEIFPPITGQELKMMTVAVRDLTLKFKMGDETAAKLKTVFKGLASTLDIVVRLVSALVSGVGRLIQGMLPAGKSVLDVAESISLWVIGLRDSIKSGDTFNKFVNDIVYTLKSAASGIKTFINDFVEGFNTLKTNISNNGVFKGILDTISGFWTSIAGMFSGAKNSSTGGVTDFVTLVKTRFTPLYNILEGLGKLLSPIAEQFGRITSAFSKVAGSVGKVGGNLLDTLLTNFEKIDFTKIDYKSMFDGLNAALMSGLIYSINRFITKGPQAFDNIGEMFKDAKSLTGGAKSVVEGVKGVLDGVKTSLEAWQQSLRVDMLSKIAGAIAVLTISLVALSMLDSQKLTVALGAITVMFTELFGSLAVFEKISSSTGYDSMSKAVMGMFGMSVALLVLTGAVSQLAKIEPEKLASATLAIVGLTAILLLASKYMSNNSGAMLKGSIGFIAFGFAMQTLVGPVKQLGDIDRNKLAQGIGAIGVLITELAIFMAITKKQNLGVFKSLDMYLLASSLSFMAASVAKFGEMDKAKVVQGLETLGIVLFELFMFSKLSANSTITISTAIGLAILGGALLIFAEAVKRMGELSWDEIERGLVAMGGSLLVISVAMRTMPPNMLLTATSLVVVGASLYILAQSLTIMGKMSWEEIARGLVILASSLTILSLAMLTMNSSLPGSAALIVAAGALAILAPALKLLGTMKWEDIVRSLVGLAGVLVIFGIAGMVLTPVIPTLLALAGVMVLFGLACLVAGVGILAASVGLGALAISGVAGAAALGLMLQTIFGLIPQLAIAFAAGVVTFANEIQKGAPAIFLAVTAIILGLLKTVVDTGPALIETLTVVLLSLISAIVAIVPAFVDAEMVIISAMLATFDSQTPKMIQSGFGILISFLTGFRDNIGKVVTVAIEVVLAFNKGVEAKIPEIVASAFTLILAFINGLTDAVDRYMPQLMQAVTKLFGAIISGIIAGLTDNMGLVQKAFTDLAQGAIDSFNEAIDSNSPAKEFIKSSYNIVQGLVVGMDKYGPLVSSSASELGDKAVSGMQGLGKKISEAFSTSFDGAPTIRPVVDLTDIQSGAKAMDRMFANPSLKIGGNTDGLIGTISNGFATQQTDTTTGVIGSSNSTSLVFNQTNYSPVPLSRIEIYRQTNNLLKSNLGARA